MVRVRRKFKPGDLFVHDDEQCDCPIDGLGFTMLCVGSRTDGDFEISTMLIRGRVYEKVISPGVNNRGERTRCLFMSSILEQFWHIFKEL